MANSAAFDEPYVPGLTPRMSLLGNGAAHVDGGPISSLPAPAVAPGANSGATNAGALVSAGIAPTLASTVAYGPSTTIEKALFNFDAAGINNFKLIGTVAVSVSDAFTYAQYQSNPNKISRDIYTSLSSGSANWTDSQLANINLITSTYHNFIALDFSPVVNYSGNVPSDLAQLSNINISLIYRTDLKYSGESALGTDTSFRYLGSNGDIVLNVSGFGSLGLSNDESLNSSSFGFHALMHEIGHSIGLSHPHSSITNGITTLTADFAATVDVGFDKLGFVIANAGDMNKEYFTVMSYDDISPATGGDTFAQTPMILDVIALQGAYGEGAGSSGSGNDTIAPGSTGGVVAYRTYFDTGGMDLIDLKNYATGAYLQMGVAITGAAHPVGVSMSMADEKLMIAGGDPGSLRWFYGDFENASGSLGADFIVGNTLNNAINGNEGNDTLNGGEGNDTLTGGPGNDLLDGGPGIDIAVFSDNISGYRIQYDASARKYTVSANAGTDGSDILSNMERLKFSDNNLALDLSVNQSAGETVLLLGVVLPGKLALDPSKKQLLGNVIDLFDHGYSMTDLAGALLRLDIWSILTGQSISTKSPFGVRSLAEDTAIAKYILTNAFGIPPDATTLNNAAQALYTEPTQGTWLGQIATSSAAQAHIGLLGLAATGMMYM